MGSLRLYGARYDRLLKTALLAVTVLGSGAAGNAAAAPGEASLTCRANVALNRVYDVALDEETGELQVVNDAGTRFSGRANRYLSGRTGDVTWFLATGFASGVEVQVEAAGAQRVAFCLADTECYLCRR